MFGSSPANGGREVSGVEKYQVNRVTRTGLDFGEHQLIVIKYLKRTGLDQLSSFTNTTK
jgi:hypothetical protein